MNGRAVGICGVLTGVVWTVLSGISTWVLGGALNAAVPGHMLMKPPPGLFAFLLAVNLAGGVWAIWLYAAIRPRYGAGPRTAALAGLSWWIVSTLADATWGSFGFVPVRALLPLALVSLPEMIGAALVGARLYKE